MLLIIVMFAGDDHTVSDQERRVETNTKLTNHISIAAVTILFLELLKECFGAGVSDGA